MVENSFEWSLFSKAPIVGIVRNLTMEEVLAVLPVFREAGLTTVEITMNTPDAGNIIRQALTQEGRGLNIGAGTVCNKDDLEMALDSGAQFIVTPVLSKKVIKSCVKKGVPIFPGAYTPTEIYKAWTLGAAMVKIYPATSLGPQYIKDLKAPMSQLKLLPTGGVGLENMADFLLAGADGLGIGGQLFDKQLIQNRDWDGLYQHFKKFVNILQG
ncbi:bifunctional 4-hydroxy-2-oxoglutarate aldolase/2-dehydro-3-deoxy-phosphogluconate aldolase [Dyadobacter sp. 32]|uniref:bifunctional 4-hydroxy-2-oxoglutarate aldolase/2-dehydro-3-deoxy-phosphogluconate aldolase n=1 Tax=Dyadobacter sp. 32 TaxID=538966 RepID=UPI0011F06EAE